MSLDKSEVTEGPSDDFNPEEEEELTPFNVGYHNENKFRVTWEKGIEKREEKITEDTDGKKTPVVTYERICDYPITIFEEIKNMDSGEILYNVAIFRDGKDKPTIKVQVPADELFSSRKVHKKLASMGLNFPDYKSASLVDYLLEYYRYNQNRIARVAMYNSMGWKNNNSIFVIGKMMYSVSNPKGEPVRISTDNKIIEDFSVKGDMKKWVDGTRKLLKYPNTRFSCYVTTASPMLEIVGEESKSVNRSGGSSIGKSTMHKLAMSIYGSPKLNLTGNASPTAIEEILKILNNLPANFDDIQSADPEYFKQISYLIGNEKGRLRGKKDGGLRDVATWRNTSLSSSERPLFNESTNIGAKVRNYNVDGGLGNVDEEAVKDFEGIEREHYGHIAMYIVGVVLNNQNKIQEMYEECKKQLSEDYTETPLGDLGRNKKTVRNRMINGFAAILLGGKIFERTMKELGEETQDPVAIVKKIMNDSIKEVADKPLGIQAIEHVYDWVASCKKNFLINGAFTDKGQLPTIYGNYKPPYLDFVIKSIKEELTKAGFDYNSIKKEWKSYNFLLDLGEKNQVSIGGLIKPRVLRLNTAIVGALIKEPCPLDPEIVSTNVPDFVAKKIVLPDANSSSNDIPINVPHWLQTEKSEVSKNNDIGK